MLKLVDLAAKKILLITPTLDINPCSGVPSASLLAGKSVGASIGVAQCEEFELVRIGGSQ